MLTELTREPGKFEHKYVDLNGVERACFVLPFDECLTLISGYNVLLRHAVVKRWHELESFTSSGRSLGNDEERSSSLRNDMLRAVVNTGVMCFTTSRRRW